MLTGRISVITGFLAIGLWVSTVGQAHAQPQSLAQRVSALESAVATLQSQVATLQTQMVKDFLRNNNPLRITDLSNDHVHDKMLHVITKLQHQAFRKAMTRRERSIPQIRRIRAFPSARG